MLRGGNNSPALPPTAQLSRPAALVEWLRPMMQRLGPSQDADRGRPVARGQVAQPASNAAWPPDCPGRHRGLGAATARHRRPARQVACPAARAAAQPFRARRTGARAPRRPAARPASRTPALRQRYARPYRPPPTARSNASSAQAASALLHGPGAPISSMRLRWMPISEPACRPSRTALLDPQTFRFVVVATVVTRKMLRRWLIM